MYKEKNNKSKNQSNYKMKISNLYKVNKILKNKHKNFIKKNMKIYKIKKKIKQNK